MCRSLQRSLYRVRTLNMLSGGCAACWYRTLQEYQHQHHVIYGEDVVLSDGCLHGNKLYLKPRAPADGQ